jgi:hypothetical protein
MPSIKHEAAAQILHQDPQLVAMLLGMCGVTLPSGAVPVAADSNLSDRDPTELRADNVLVFEGTDGKVVVIAEVQKDKRDVGRIYAWPAYLCNARAKHKCDAILLVLALSRRAARESAKVIRTGHPGFNLVPLIRGPGTLPPPEGHVFGPQLTILNILTGDLDLTDHAARLLALLLIAKAPSELIAGYTRLLLTLAPQSARASLEELMFMDHLKDDFVDGLIAEGLTKGLAQGLAKGLKYGLEQGLEQGRAKGLAQGLAQGMSEGEAQLLLRAMTARGLVVPDGIRLRVTECTDSAQLELWFDRAMSATTIDEIFGQPGRRGSSGEAEDAGGVVA